MTDFTQQGITALLDGDKARARQLLQDAVQQDARDADAWLWLSRAVETDQERADCLQQVLRFDPNCPVAVQGLAQLVAGGAVSLQPAGGTSSSARVAGAPVVSPPWASPALSPPVSVSQRNGVIFAARPSLIPWAIAALLVALVFVAGLVIARSPFPGSGEINRLMRILVTFSLVICALGVGVRLIVVLLRRLFTRYTLTAEYLVVQTGILGRSRKTIPIHRIQDVAYHQSVVERPFGIGDVIVESAGERGAIRLIDLPRCQEYTEIVLRMVQEEAKTSPR